MNSVSKNTLLINIRVLYVFIELCGIRLAFLVASCYCVVMVALSSPLAVTPLLRSILGIQATCINTFHYHEAVHQKGRTYNDIIVSTLLLCVGLLILK